MSYWYLASPYSRYALGLDQAYREVCQNAALLVRAGISVFSPIAHSHGIALAGGIDPFDHAIWLPVDAPFIALAQGLIILELDGWEDSYGIGVEIQTFRASHRPILHMAPGVVPCLP